MEKAKEILEQCDRIANSYHAETTLSDIRFVKEIFKEGNAGRVVFVGQDSASLLLLAKKISDSEVLEGFSVKYAKTAFRLRLCYGEKFSACLMEDGEEREYELSQISEQLKEQDGETATEIIIRTNREGIKQFEAEFFYTPKEFREFDWKKELGIADFGFVLTSATMPLLLPEKEFLKKSMLSFLGAARLGIFMTGTEYLNNKEDLELVIERVHDFMKEVGISTKLLCTKPEEIMDYIYVEAVENIEELRILRNEQLTLGCLETLDEELERKEKIAGTDVAKAEELIKEIEKKKRQIEERGIATASDVRKKLLSEVRNDSEAAVAVYHERLVKEIVESIERSEEVSEIDGKAKSFSGYMEEKWNEFGRERNCIMVEKVQAIVESMYHEIEKDAKELFSDLEEEKKEFLLQVLMSMQQDTSEPLSASELNPERNALLSGISTAMIFASVPALLLLGPLTGGGVVVGSIVLKKYKDDQFLKRNKVELAKQVKDICTRIKGEILQHIHTQEEEIADAVDKAVRNAYGHFSDTLLEHVREQKEEADRLSGHKEEIRLVRETELPKLRQRLME